LLLTKRLPILVAIAGLLYLLFFHRLADRDLWSSHEARAAMDGQSVLDGDVLLPHLYDGRAEMQKPPLYYWLVAATAWLRGGSVDAWAVRLPAALAAIGCVACVGWLAGSRGGLFAALVLATAVHFTWLGRIGRIDMPLSLTTALSITTFHLSVQAAGRRKAMLLFAGYLSIAAGVLLKGPIGLVLPAAVIVADRLLAWWLNRSSISGFGWWWGLALVGVLTVPWFVWANAHTNGEFFREFFWRHNVERGTGGGDLRSHAWWLYLPYFLNDTLPWSVLLPPALWLCWRRGWWREDAILRLGLVWLVVIVGGLSLSAFKRGDYLLPAYPGMALFLGRVLHCWGEEMVWRRRVAIGLVSLVVACVAVGWLVRTHRTLPAQEAYRDYTAFAAVIRRESPAPREVVFFRTEAHALAFHTGRPLRTLSEWEELERQLEGPGDHYVVMPPEAATEVRVALPGVRWVEVTSNVELAGGSHERPLLLLQSRSKQQELSVRRESF
jgi:4-amino-4-deoxy-L-arabinose transferase-like glycosyltransferase